MAHHHGCGDNGGVEGVTGWKMFCIDDNGCAVGISRDLLLGGGDGVGDGGGPCDGRGRGVGQKFEL